MRDPPVLPSALLGGHWSGSASTPPAACYNAFMGLHGLRWPLTCVDEQQPAAPARHLEHVSSSLPVAPANMDSQPAPSSQAAVQTAQRAVSPSPDADAEYADEAFETGAQETAGNQRRRAALVCHKQCMVHASQFHVQLLSLCPKMLSDSRVHVYLPHQGHRKVSLLVTCHYASHSLLTCASLACCSMLCLLFSQPRVVMRILKAGHGMQHQSMTQVTPLHVHSYKAVRLLLQKHSQTRLPLKQCQLPWTFQRHQRQHHRH